MNEGTTGLATTEVAALRYGVQRLSRRLRKRAGDGLTAAQMSALATVGRHGSLRLGELARFEQVGKSTVTRLVAWLETSGYLARETDPDDGRGFVVTLTGAGEAVLREASERQDAYLSRQLEALDEDDRQTLRAAIPVIERLLGVKA